MSGARLLLALACLSLTSCYSFHMQRQEIIFSAAGQDERLHVEAWHPAGMLWEPEPRQWLGVLLANAALFPVDVLGSSIVALRAPFDDSYEIRGGALGALAGIALPGLTCVPAPLRFIRAHEIHEVQAETLAYLRGEIGRGRGAEAVQGLLRHLQAIGPGEVTGLRFAWVPVTQPLPEGSGLHVPHRPPPPTFAQPYETPGLGN